MTDSQPQTTDHRPTTGLRVADADRERIAERLRSAAAEGRLSPDELEERLEQAFGARTFAELEPVVADLPRTGGAARPRRNKDLRPFLATSVLLVVIWALTGADYFWPVWPILGWGVFALGPMRQIGFSRCRPSASSRP